MPVIFSIELEGDEELLRRLAGIDRALKGDRLIEPWERMTEMVGSSARDRAPHDLGFLLASIEEEVIVEDDEIIGVVYSDLFYAPFQEAGKPRYFPNLEALEEWAERHDTSAWVVALAIDRRGIVPIKFFEESILENQEEIVDLVGPVVIKILVEEY